MNRWIRIVRHRLLDERYARRVIGQPALERIQAATAQSELTHTGEIRVCIEASLPLSYLWRRADARERAIAMFGKLGVWDTQANNGVLIYLLLAEHRIEIVADRGVQQHVDGSQWRSVVEQLASACRDGQFEAGIIEAIGAVDRLLRLHFPHVNDQANPDELSNRPDVR